LWTSANSLNGFSQRVTGIVGPALGAALVAAGGTSITFGLDALSFFVSALCVLPLLRENIERPKTQDISPENITKRRTVRESLHQGLADMRGGWEAIITVPWIWVGILIFGFINMTEASPRAVALPFLIKDDLGADVGLLGLLGSASSLGFVLATLWLGQYVRLHRRGLLGYFATMMTGVVLLFFGWKLPIPILIGGMFIVGMCHATFTLIWNHTLQEMVPPELLGRVYSIDALGSFVLLPVGFGITGWATDLIGAPTVFLIGGFATIALVAAGLTHPAIRNLD
jgi:DHA3 family tetracycline resistance protein-like MFS transporter